MVWVFSVYINRYVGIYKKHIKRISEAKGQNLVAKTKFYTVRYKVYAENDSTSTMKVIFMKNVRKVQVLALPGWYVSKFISCLGSHVTASA